MANVLKTTTGKAQFRQMCLDHNPWLKFHENKFRFFLGNPPDSFGINHRSRRSKNGIKW